MMMTALWRLKAHGLARNGDSYTRSLELEEVTSWLHDDFIPSWAPFITQETRKALYTHLRTAVPAAYRELLGERPSNWLDQRPYLAVPSNVVTLDSRASSALILSSWPSGR